MDLIKTGRAGESSHWYTPTGEAAYEVPKANGDGMKATTLREARKLGLLWSVTTIIRAAAKPNLERWKNDQLLLAALTSPDWAEYETGEITQEEFVKRVQRDANEQARVARDRGTSIHGAIETFLITGDLGLVLEEDVDHAVGIKECLDENFNGITDWEPERSFGHRLGFGGKVDLSLNVGSSDKYPNGIVLDFKGKDFTVEEADKVRGYDDHAMQLAAYREGLGLGGAACFNLFFSRTVPGLCVLVPWAELEIQRGWGMFQSLLKYKILETGHDPSF